MDRHWSNFCTLSIVHFMAFPECIGGDVPIFETVTKIRFLKSTSSSNADTT